MNKKKSNQRDELLHKIQQEKMKELLDNKEDEVRGFIVGEKLSNFEEF